MIYLVEDELKRFLTEECGQGLTEYALILLLMALTVVGGLTVLGQGILDLFDYVLDKEVFSSTLPGPKVG